MIAILIGTLFIIICLLLIVVVLLQKGRGGGLGAAFGGMASSAFGTRVGDVFTWVTIVLTALYLLLAVGTTMYFRPKPSLVATPIFTPSPELPYNDPVDVTIQCPTREAEIYYTLDGSDPSDQSRRYESVLRLEPGTTIKARAYRAGGWTPSRIAQGYYGPAVGEAASQPSGEEAFPAPLAPVSQPAPEAARAPAG